MSKSKALFIVTMLVASIIALAESVNAQEGKTVNVDIVPGAADVENGRFYSPQTVTIETGTTISWMNLDKDPHTVTDGTPQTKWGQIFESGLLRQGKEFRYTFNDAGVFPYLCALHPWMYGKVIVENPIKNIGVKVIQKLNVFVKSEHQSYSEDEIVRFSVDVLGAGNKPTDPDVIDAQFGYGGEVEQIKLSRLDIGKYTFATAELKPNSYSLSVEVSKEGFESGYSILTVHIIAKEPVKEIVEPSIPAISIATEQANYNAGDTVVIDGKVSKAVENKSVVFQVINPENKLYTRGQTQLNSDGLFEWTFKVAKTAPSGTWTVKTKYVDEIVTTSFEIIKSGLENTLPTEAELATPNIPVKFKNEKVTIVKSVITDQTTSQLSNVNTGQLVMVQSVVRNNQEMVQTFAYIVQIKDSNGIVVKLEAVEGALPAGKSFTVGISWTPEEVGKYRSEVYVWKSIMEPVPLSLNLLKSNIIVTN
ncbi:MAG: MG2 domain-containing protein [Nitrososphaerales archaeon]